MTDARRTRLLMLAGVAALAVAAVLAVLLLTGRSPQGDNGLSSGRPVRASAALSPAAALFGDTVTARVQLDTDTRFVDPSSVRVKGSFAPYREVSRPLVRRQRVGSTEEIVWTTSLRCLGSACVAHKRGKRFAFAPATVTYSVVDRAGAPRSLAVALPGLLVY